MFFPKITHESAALRSLLSQSTGHTNVYDMTQLYRHKTGSSSTTLLSVLMDWHLGGGGDQPTQHDIPSDSLSLSQTIPTLSAKPPLQNLVSKIFFGEILLLLPIKVCLVLA